VCAFDVAHTLTPIRARVPHFVAIPFVARQVNKEAVYNTDDTDIKGITTHKYFCASSKWKMDFVLYAYEMLQVVICMKVRPQPLDCDRIISCHSPLILPTRIRTHTLLSYATTFAMYPTL
jgi:hypothetical protein